MKKLLALLVLLGGCFSHVKVEPVTVAPIHVTVDVNMHDDAKPRPSVLP